MRHARAGVTLVELTIALLIGAVIGVAMLQVLVSETRFMSRESMSREARAAVVSGLGILASDLRMMEYSPGNSTGIVVSATEPSDSALTVRLPIAFAIACSANTLVIAPWDSTRLVFGGIGAASFDGYAIRTASAGYVYQNRSGSWLTIPSTSTACASPPPAIITGGGGSGLRLANSVAAMTPAPARGAVVMLWVRVRYRIGASTTFTSPPRRALFISLGTTSVERELIAPLDTGARFRYYDAVSSDTARTSAPADATTIRGVQFILPGLSSAIAQARTTAEASRVVTSIFFQNVP